MKIKTNISVQDRIDFVNFVVDSCEVEGRHVHALFDFAWRAAVVKWFAGYDPEGKTQDEICDYVYSNEGIGIVTDPEIAEVTSGLYEACENEIKDRAAKYMVMYQSLVRPDPMDRIAAAFEEVAGALKSLNDPQMLVEIAKKAGLVGKDKHKTASHKAPAAKTKE